MLLSTSVSFVLAWKQVSAADLSKAKISFFYFSAPPPPFHLFSFLIEQQEPFSYMLLQTSKGRGLGV